MATPLNVDQLKTVLRGGVRTNLFRVDIAIPGAVDTFGLDSNLIGVLTKAAQIPQATLGSIEVPFRGTRYKMPGDRTFEPWTMTVLNDPDMRIRSMFENWSNAFKGFASNVAVSDPAELYGSVEIYQLNQQGEIIPSQGSSSTSSWKLTNCWPSDISAIDLSYDDENTLSQFTVTWQYQYWIHEIATDRAGTNVNNLGE